MKIEHSRLPLIHLLFQKTIELDDDESSGSMATTFEQLALNENSLRPSPGGPFSALTPSMWPQDILAKLGEPESEQAANDQPEYRFDEFGFRVEEEDGPEQSSNKLLGIPFTDDANQAKWIAYLEFSQQNEVTTDITWDTVDVVLPRTEKLRAMVREGIAHSLRPQMWMRLSGALQKKLKSETTYREMVKVK